MTLKRPAQKDDWVKGSLDAGVTLIEYGDFQCPFCGEAYWELERLNDAAGDRLAFVYRHFPLVQVHPYAQIAAEAAEAAGAQGRFWEMHGTLFENQADLRPESLLQYAQALGLDMERFSDDLEQHRHRSKVRRDFMEGVRSGVNGTPTFFVNGERYVGPNTAEGLLAALQGQPTEASGYSLCGDAGLHA